MPADREPLIAAPRVAEDDASFILPVFEDEGPDAGSRSWASTDADTIMREAHLRRVAGAYGLAGSMAGMSLTCLLISTSQEDEAFRRGWRRAALVTGGVGGVAFVSATVLWALTPEAPGRPRLAAGPAAGLTLAFTY